MHAKLKGNRKDPVKGFTLLEVLIAFVVLSAALLAMATLTGSIMGYNQFSDHMTKATTLAQDKIEEFRNNSTGIASSTSPETVETLYSRSWTVADDTPAGGMKTVAVTVAFIWQSRPHQVVLKTIILQ